MPQVINVEETDYCKVKINYETDLGAINTKRDEVVKHFRGRKVPGFRDGKVSDQVLRISFKKEIEQATAQELAKEAFHNSLFEKKLKPFGQPQFSVINLDTTKFVCEFQMLVQPTFDLKTYKGFEIPKPGGFMAPEEISAKLMEQLRQKHGETTLYTDDDFAQTGDNVVISYKASLDGKEDSRLAAENELLVLGQASIPGFNENLLGMKMGETRTFELRLPSNLDPEIADKVVSFEVKLNLGSKVIPAALDDELAKKLGLADFNDLNAKVQASAVSRVKDMETEQINNQIANRLLENHDFKVPPYMALAEAQIGARNSGKNWDDISDTEKEVFVSGAEKSIKLSLVLNAIRENEPDAQLSNEEIVQIARQNLALYSNNPDETLQELVKTGQIAMLMSKILDENTLNFIKNNSTIIE